MNTKFNKSDYILLGIYFLISNSIQAYDYYLDDNSLLEYVVDLPLRMFLSLLLIYIYIKWLIPKYIVKEKKYLHFIFYGVFFMALLGIISRVVGYWTEHHKLIEITSYSNLFIYGVSIMANSIGMPFGLLLAKKFYEDQTQFLKIEKQQKENELKLLRSQINPHFLFNNLNTLDSLIDSNAEKAKEYINRLSLIYRYLIKTKDAEVMELSEEIQLAENYMFLIKTRFEDDYDFKIDIQTSIKDKFIPTGAIQTLLENVVKHNKPQNRNSIKAIISIEENTLKVTNTKSNIQTKNESFGTGLENLKARYQLLSDKEVIVINTDKEFNISIPIIKLIDED